MNAEHSNILNCMQVNLLNRDTCVHTIVHGDFRYNLMCGQGVNSRQSIALVVTLSILCICFIFMKTNSLKNICHTHKRKLKNNCIKFKTVKL